MSLQVLSTIFALAIYFVIFSSLYSDNNLFSVEAQPSIISDHEFHGYIEQMIGHLDASILNVTAELITIASEEYTESMSQGNIINFLEYQDGQQFFNRAIILLNKLQVYLSENDKNYLIGLNELKKGMDSKIDPSEIDMNVKDMLCEIKKGLYC